MANVAFTKLTKSFGRLGKCSRDEFEHESELPPRKLQQTPAPKDLSHLLTNFSNLGINPSLRRSISSLEALPNELLINVFVNLHGHVKDLRSVMLTCHHFHRLLTRHDHIIVQNLVRGRPVPELFLLANLGLTNVQWSPFSWLAAGDRMNNIIDSTLFHLERVGALQDEKHIFREGTTKPDQGPAWCMLKTILMATQIISMQGDHQARYGFIAQTSPNLLNSYASQMEGIVDFLLCNPYTSIQDSDADMGGTDFIDLPLPDHLGDITMILQEGVLIFGPWLLLCLLDRKHKFPNYKHFVGWLFRLYDTKELGRHELDGYTILVPDEATEFLTFQHEHKWMHEPDTFGLRIIRDMHLTKWTKALPDKNAWADMMLDSGWVPLTGARSICEFLKLPTQA